MKADEKEIYDVLWRCRDLEIQHYWHRMVFMTAFMLLCFAGYGGAFLAFLSGEKCKLPFEVENGILFYLTLVGLVVSLLWLMMSKGSKAWYEEYEKAIEAFQKSLRKSPEVKDSMRHYVTLDYSSFPAKKRLEVNDWLWSTGAGTYSVSRIGIAIGHLSAIIWAAMALIHYQMGSCASDWNSAFILLRTKMFAPANMGFSGILLLLAFWIYARTSLKSSYLQGYNR